MLDLNFPPKLRDVEFVASPIKMFGVDATRYVGIVDGQRLVIYTFPIGSPYEDYVSAIYATGGGAGEKELFVDWLWKTFC